MRILLLAVLLIPPALAGATGGPGDAAPPAPPPAQNTGGDYDPTGDVQTITQAQNAGQQDLQTVQQLQDKHDVTSRQQVAAAREDLSNQKDVIQKTGDAHPDSQRVNVTAGDAMLGLGEPKRSLPLLSRAIDVATAKGDRAVLGHALFSRAAANAALKDYPAVVRDAKKVLELDPNNQQAQILINLYKGRAASTGGGDIQTQMQPSDAAQSGGGSGLAQQAAPAGFSYGGLAAPNVQTAAQIEVARLVKLAADKAGLDPKAARSILNQALAADPKNVPALIARARVENKDKDFSPALADADQAAKLSPKTAEAYYLRAQAKQGLGYKTDDVAADYATARELDPAMTGAELAALASGGAAAAGGPGSASSLAAEAANARSRAIYKTGWFDSLLQNIPPQYRVEFAAALWWSVIFAATAVVYFFVLRRKG